MCMYIIIYIYHNIYIYYYIYIIIFIYIYDVALIMVFQTKSLGFTESGKEISFSRDKMAV